MEPNLREISDHMLQLGLAALSHANWHANYHHPENPMANELSVLQAAHAAEILIKARIAEEHPLLIFEHLPKPDAQSTAQLSFQQVVEHARTFAFRDLPDRLWAVTGILMANVKQYQAFGRLRNSIQHFAVPANVSASAATIDFIYQVIDPFIHKCWGLYAVDFNEDSEPHVYLVDNLVRHGIKFLVSPGVVESIGSFKFEWPSDQAHYRIEMERRFAEAKVLSAKTAK